MNYKDESNYNYLDDIDSSKRKHSRAYSSNDFVHGIRGYFVKLFVSFILFFMSTSLIILVLSSFIFISALIYILVFSVITMLTVCGTSIVLKENSNFIKIVPIILLSVVIFLISPYELLLTLIFIAYNFIVSVLVIKKLNLPEKIALNQNLLFVSCLFFCVYQILFALPFFKVESAIQAKNIYTIVGILWMFIIIFVLNFMNLKRNSTNSKVSKGIIIGNVYMTIFFAVLVAIISSVSSTKDILYNIVKKILLFINGDFIESKEIIKEDVVENLHESFLPMVEETEISPFWNFIEKVAIVLVVLFLIVLVFFIIKSLIKVLKKAISKILGFLSEKDSSRIISSYKDKKESIFDKKQISNSIKKRWENIKNVFIGKQKYKDMKNNRDKIRYIYKSIQRNDKKSNMTDILNKTAREYIVDNNDKIASKTFIHGYEKARYSNHEIVDSEVDAGLNIVGLVK